MTWGDWFTEMCEGVGIDVLAGMGGVVIVLESSFLVLEQHLGENVMLFWRILVCTYPDGVGNTRCGFDDNGDDRRVSLLLCQNLPPTPPSMN